MSGTEQTANIKLCVFLHKSPSDILQMLEEANGKVAMKKMQVYEWHKCFCVDCVSINAVWID
jgi:hypothetical protein